MLERVKTAAEEYEADGGQKRPGQLYALKRSRPSGPGSRDNVPPDRLSMRLFDRKRRRYLSLQSGRICRIDNGKNNEKQ